MYVDVYCIESEIKTHNSESRSQEEATVRDEWVSYLQVAPLKNKSCHLVIIDLVHSFYIESIYQQWSK